MFAVCSVVLIVVSLATKAPERSRLAGLTFATVQEKLYVRSPDITAKSEDNSRVQASERLINMIFSSLLALSVIGLWIYFR